MRKEEFFYDSRDGQTRIHAVRYLPEESALKDGKPVAIFQIVHGMEEYIERYEGFAEFLTGKGFLVIGEDHLGHGKTVTEGGTYGYFCETDPATVVVRDVHRLKKLTQEQYPGVPIILMGHSMGSFIVRNYICRYGTGIKAAIIMGTGMLPAGTVKLAAGIAALQNKCLGPKHKATLLRKMSFAGYFKKIPHKATDCDWLSRNDRNVQAYIADPLCGFGFTVNGYMTLFELITRMQDEENVKKIPQELPVYLVSGEEDPVGAFGEGVRETRDALKMAGLRDVTMKLYQHDRHEILNEDDHRLVEEELYQWVMSKIS